MRRQTKSKYASSLHFRKPSLPKHNRFLFVPFFGGDGAFSSKKEDYKNRKTIVKKKVGLQKRRQAGDARRRRIRFIICQIQQACLRLNDILGLDFIFDFFL